MSVEDLYIQILTHEMRIVHQNQSTDMTNPSVNAASGSILDHRGPSPRPDGFGNSQRQNRRSGLDQYSNSRSRTW